MKKIIYNLFIFSAIAILSNCTEDSFQTVVDYEVPLEKKKMVINGEVTAGNDTMVIFLSRSRTSSEAIFDPTDTLSKAALTLYKDGAKYKDLIFVKKEIAIDGDQQEQYMFKFIALLDKDLPLVKYSLKGSAIGYDDISADDILPPAVKVQNARFEKDGFESLTTNIGGKPTKTIKDLIEFTFDDPTGNNYYLLEVRSTQADNQGVLVKRVATFDMNQQFAASSGGFSGRKAIIPDQTFDGRNFKVQLGVSPRGGGKGGGNTQTISEYEVILRSVSRNSYLFEQALASYNANNGNPFAEPVVLFTNVYKGFGLFSMQQKATVILKP
jgi:hypothetical protein